MRNMTNDEIRLDIAGLTERLRQIRIEKGLPPDPPEREDFVEIPLSLALVERLQPFRAIAVRYASILAAGQVARIDMDKLAEYAEMARVLNRSVGFFCSLHALGANGVLAAMKRINALIDAGRSDEINTNKEMRGVHYCIEWMTKDEGLRHDLFDQHGKYDMDARKEAEHLLSNPDALRAAVDAAKRKLEEDDIDEQTTESA
ncbi:MAG: hypothetical protein E7L01_01880 [Paenibacillus macerans]|uniref:hypothetical protein n=1 Tax=Paenibacillus TaxID=44249 RepID=UPI0029157FF2|nr:hypothetical protein [Paenibacillus macerans]MDU7472099.1 hypothetical protein [Paenibacillus macerans]